MPNQVHPQTKKSRYHKVMSLQQEISKENLQEKLGKKYEVMIEGITKNEKYYVGRSYMDTPEIDGVIYLQTFNCLPDYSFFVFQINWNLDGISKFFSRRIY